MIKKEELRLGNPIVWDNAEKMSMRVKRERTYHTFSRSIKGSWSQDLDNSVKDRMTILVCIPSFRDPELCNTIRDCFDKALYPKRIRIAVVEQNDPKDPFDCHAHNSGIDPFHLKIKTLHCKDAQGPTYARRLLQELHNGEDWILGLDSHIRFDKGWDVFMIDDIHKCERPTRTVLTVYPLPFDRKEDEKDKEKLTYVISSRKNYRFSELTHFDSEGNLCFKSVSYALKPMKPSPAPMIAAGLYFVHQDFVKLVPWGPHTPHVFFGEEMLLTARAFTHGFEIMVPTEVVFYHEWNRGYRVNFYANEGLRKKGIKWIQDILSDKIVDPVFGLGNIRTIKHFWDYAGVCFEKRIFTRPLGQPFVPPSDWKPLDAFIDHK
jgi:[Skp1-protein]-hydroxyproline N-acetylglucosaminyltransferase